ncbi:MAG: hypothetical protein IJG33_15295 [Selenomonadaceae bacterium]|nr:hypothetical protein [Selenomonadaceae bacterium]
MKPYTKPTITGGTISGLILIMAPVFISPIAPVAAVAAAILSKKGNSIIDSTHTIALTARKDFSLA